MGLADGTSAVGGAGYSREISCRQGRWPNPTNDVQVQNFHEPCADASELPEVSEKLDGNQDKGNDHLACESIKDQDGR